MLLLTMRMVFAQLTFENMHDFFLNKDGGAENTWGGIAKRMSEQAGGEEWTISSTVGVDARSVTVQ